jgi:hypothetical protein
MSPRSSSYKEIFDNEEFCDIRNSLIEIEKVVVPGLSLFIITFSFCL